MVIEILNGAEDGRLIECPEFPITIGRASDNVVHLPYDHLVSRHHACIQKKGEMILLRDLHSTNGTFIRNRRVKSDVAIEFNKTFRVGATLLNMKLRSSKE